MAGHPAKDAAPSIAYPVAAGRTNRPGRKPSPRRPTAGYAVDLDGPMIFIPSADGMTR